MSTASLIRGGMLCGWACLLSLSMAFGGEPVAAESHRVSVATARERAKLMHEIYAATLHTMHERYFHGERAVVPAQALEEVFAEIKRQSKADARWISINLKPMSIHHEPKSDFEKQAAKEIAGGKTEVEAVEGGYYRRARAIPLGDGCIQCHAGLFAQPTKSPKYAGLVISLPVNEESGKSE